MEAVNQLRAEAGKEAVEKLTVPVLKDFLKVCPRRP